MTQIINIQSDYPSFIKMLPINTLSTTIISESSHGTLLIPHDNTTACRYGMRWCDNEIFKLYDEQGSIYIWIDKKSDYKFYFWFGRNIEIKDLNYENLNTQKIKYILSHSILSDFITQKQLQMKPHQLTLLAEITRTPFSPSVEDIIIDAAIEDDVIGARQLFEYIRYVYKGRAKYVEDRIMRIPQLAEQYARFVLNNRWYDAEKYIMKDPTSAYYYSLFVLNNRWYDAEKYITRDAATAYLYALNILKKRWKYDQDEDIIARDPHYAMLYARDIIKGRWRRAEKIIREDERSKYFYERDVLRNKMD